MTRLLADIALPVPVHHTFTYVIPDHLTASVQRGSRVLVSFGRKHLTGVVVNFPTDVQIRGLKPIREILDDTPSFSGEMLDLTNWIADYYMCPWGEVLKSATPQGLSQGSDRVVRIIAEDVETILGTAGQKTKRQHDLLQALRNGPLSIGQLKKRTHVSGIHSVLDEMVKRGWVEISEQLRVPKAKPKLESVVELTDNLEGMISVLPKKLTARQIALLEVLRGFRGSIEQKVLIKKAGSSLAVLKSLESKALVRIFREERFRPADEEQPEPPPSITLNKYQSIALSEIVTAIETSHYKTFLLHGVTGSGKTQVYIEAIRTALSQEKSAIVLVPEISLTPQIVRRFRSHFGKLVAVMHSQMSIGERFDAWRMARAGDIRIVIGPRSAIFAPLPNLGLIVVDEEHESSYKQHDAAPRYHARDVAVVRGSLASVPVVLGSATPSMESYYNGKTGKYHILELPVRVDDAQLPRVDIVDMTEERKSIFAELKKQSAEKGVKFPRRLPQSSISGLLRHQISERMKRHEGTILLQNRRGFAHVMECFDCGFVERCNNCEVTLTYHLSKKHLRCHYCGFVKKPTSVCPDCGGIELRYHAFGTQQVQQELQGMFPEATIIRLDLDTTTRKGSHNRLLQQFERGEADILLGTQMVAKGLDFPRVTLVGVISADTQMLLPDFRSSERTFQLLTQVSGRSGRSTLTGEVVIQTMQPHHYSLKHVTSHNFVGFYDEELNYRRELDYPPFSRIVLVEFKGKNEEEVLRQAKAYAELLRKRGDKNSLIVLGPADAAISKMKGQHRTIIVLKNLKATDPSGSKLRTALTAIRARSLTSRDQTRRGVFITIDVDPHGMM